MNKLPGGGQRGKTGTMQELGHIIPKLFYNRLRTTECSMVSKAALRSNAMSTMDEPVSIAGNILSRASSKADLVEK